MKKYALFAGIGLELVGITAFSLWIGQKLENTYPTEGLLLVICLLLGFSGWTARIILSLRKLSRDQAKNTEKNLADDETKL